MQQMLLQADVFESLVNTKGFQTSELSDLFMQVFESLVNTKGFQTKDHRS